MQFQIEVKKFLDYVTVMTSILDSFGKNGQNYAIAGTKRGPVLLGESGPALAIFDIGAAMTVDKGTFSFGFDPKIFIPMIQKRANIEMEYAKSTLRFKARGQSSVYSGECVTLPVGESLEGHANSLHTKRTGIPLTSATLDVIGKGSKLARITPIHNSEKDILTHVRARDGRVVISCADNYHSSLFVSEKLKKLQDFHTAFPAGYFDYMDRVRGAYSDANHSLSLTDKSVVLFSEGYMVSLPAVQVEANTFDRVEQLFSKEDFKKPLLTFDLEHEKLDAAVANFQSIIESGANIEIENPNPKCVKLKLKSNHGSLSDTIKVENLEVRKFKGAKIDPDALLDSMAALGGVISVSVIRQPEAFVISHKVEGVGHVRHLGLQLV